MSRVQLALNVNDIDEAVSFYTALFGTEPAKRRPGAEQAGVERDRLLEVVDVEGELETGHGCS